ncbi:hypothetical protein D3C80_1887910 [compost metagenome]
MALLFKVNEERRDQFRRHVREHNRGRRFAQSGLRKLEEQHKGIAVGSYGLGAERPLLGQVLGKVGLYERGE